MNITLMAALLPVLFMIHEFEEIIMIEPWQKKHKSYLDKAGKKAFFSHCQSTVTTALGISEEFLLFSLVTFFSCLSGNYTAWLGVCAAFVLHLIFPHMIKGLAIMPYTPGIVTSVLLILPSFYLIFQVVSMLHYSAAVIILSVLIGCAIIAANLLVLQHNMKTLEKWIERFIEGK